MVNLAFATTLTLGISLANAATQIAVLEYGPSATIHSINDKRTLTTVAAVSSFWSALHNGRRKLQHPGMVVVADLFNKPDHGIVISVTGSGVDLESMPFLSTLVSSETSSAVGRMELVGNKAVELLSTVDYETVIPESIVESTVQSCQKNGFSGVLIQVDSDKASDVDSKIKNAIHQIERLSQERSENIAVHVVVDDSKSVSRRLEEAAADANADANEADANADANANANGYYGYGYYNDNNEWVTPYKTMHQIQYFNLVLWTSVMLFLILFYSMFLMVNMPLEADTLLFGESAKFVGED